MRPTVEPTLTPSAREGWRWRWFEIIYRHDTRPARNFDLLLIVAIMASVTVIVLDSVPRLHARFGGTLLALEWGFTILFTVEYVVRLLVVREQRLYALSAWGIIDLASILPLYLSFVVPGAQTLLTVRILRLLRLFRILKLTQYVEESGVLLGALWRSRRKILVFFSAVLTIALVFGAVMYAVEGPANGFTSIPTGMYWAVVTMATVGFGDLAPTTTAGRFITSILILIGYSIIAVPTGIYTAELAAGARRPPRDARACPGCAQRGHEPDAHHCRHCGAVLADPGG